MGMGTYVYVCAVLLIYSAIYTKVCVFDRPQSSNKSEPP